MIQTKKVTCRKRETKVRIKDRKKAKMLSRLYKTTYKRSTSQKAMGSLLTKNSS